MAKRRNGKRLVKGGNGKTSPVTPIAIMPQPQGGYLQVGNPGNRGGPGRPRDRVRLASLLSFEKRIPVLEQIADGQCVERVKVVGGDGAPVEVERSAAVSERIRAVEVLGRAGMSADPPKQTIGMMTDGKRVEVIVRYDDADET